MQHVECVVEVSSSVRVLLYATLGCVCASWGICLRVSMCLLFHVDVFNFDVFNRRFLSNILGPLQYV